MVIPYFPVPMPSRLSNPSGPVEGLVTAPSWVTSWSRLLKICTPVELLKAPLVARSARPLELFTKSLLAVASQVSRCQGSSFRPVPTPWALRAAAS